MQNNTGGSNSGLPNTTHMSLLLVQQKTAVCRDHYLMVTIAHTTDRQREQVVQTGIVRLHTAPCYHHRYGRLCYYGEHTTHIYMGTHTN